MTSDELTPVQLVEIEIAKAQERSRRRLARRLERQRQRADKRRRKQASR